MLATPVAQTRTLEGQLEASPGQHPAAEILLSQAGLGGILGVRVPAEFGADQTRYANPKARKNYAGTAPITKAPAPALAPGGHRQAAARRAAPASLRRTDQLAGRPRLIRRASRPRLRPQPGPASGQQ